MKLFLLVVSAVFIFSCSHFLSRTPSSISSNKPRHIIFTVHGLTGDQTTFGVFNEATKKYLESVDPNYIVEVHTYTYPTGRNENWGSSEFAFDSKFGLGQFVNEKLAQAPLNSSDKISFVCHSQGGIVTYMWYFNSILQQNSDFEIAKKVDSIITLGTPFWGSKIASILTDKRNPDIIPLIKAFAPDNMKMTRREISDLAFASDTIHLFRTLAIKMDSDPDLYSKIARLPVRMVNITGILPQNKNDLFTAQSNNISDLTRKIINFVYKLYTSSYRDNKRVESDIAVPVSSSRWNFIYSQPQKITNEHIVDSGAFSNFKNLVSRSKFLYTESAHMPFEIETTFSMAYIGKSCLAVESCDHPTYRYILEQLADCKNNKCDKLAFENVIQKMKAVNLQDHQNFKQIRDNLQSFALQVDIKLPSGSIDKFPVRYFRMKNTGTEEFTGYDSWEFNEYSLKGRVIDLKTDKKKDISIASTDKEKIYLADRDEKHSINIVSRKATANDPFDRLRVNVFGRIDSAEPVTDKSFTVPIEIRLPRYPKVVINALVRPTHSTFTELDYTSAPRIED